MENTPNMSKPHGIFAGFCDFCLLTTVLNGVFMLVSFFAGRIFNLSSYYITNIFLLLVVIGSVIAYHSRIADRVVWLTPGELIAGRDRLDNQKAWKNPYGTNRWGLFLITILSLIAAGSLFQGGGFTMVHSLSDLVGRFLVLFAVISGSIMIGKGRSSGAYLIIVVYLVQIINALMQYGGYYLENVSLAAYIALFISFSLMSLIYYLKARKQQIRKVSKRTSIIIPLFIIAYFAFSFLPVVAAWQQQGVHSIDFTQFSSNAIKPNEAILYGSETSIYNNKLYYLNEAYSGSLYSVNLDGKDNRSIADQYASNFIIKDDRIFYLSYGGLFSMNLDGTDQKCLDTQAWYSPLVICGDWIYYSIKVPAEVEGQTSLEGTLARYQMRKVKRMKLDGSSTEIFEDTSCSTFATDGKWIYYVEEGTRDAFSFPSIDINNPPSEDALYKKVFAIEIESRTKHDIKVKAKDEIVMLNDWLYYFNKDKGFSKLKMTGGKVEYANLSQQKGSNLKAFGGDLYFITYGKFRNITICKYDGSKNKVIDLLDTNDIYGLDVTELGLFYSNTTVKPAIIDRRYFVPHNSKDKILFMSDLYIGFMNQ